jgi:hypothetical protein
MREISVALWCDSGTFVPLGFSPSHLCTVSFSRPFAYIFHPCSNLSISELVNGKHVWTYNSPSATFSSLVTVPTDILLPYAAIHQFPTYSLNSDTYPLIVTA